MHVPVLIVRQQRLQDVNGPVEKSRASNSARPAITLMRLWYSHRHCGRATSPRATSRDPRELPSSALARARVCFSCFRLLGRWDVCWEVVG